ncbi:CdiA family toxin C-terminal domain-containing protein [Gordonibacter sp. Marseille-P4307]|uniref:CdiA family toxin C-terminal domain-containing protein n=1 Tax=Gordonibacter sp. Marseille-P4307 TaxID=2161815 RepID=UPI000F52C733|nr:CdiA family toxin C-terminal domain-containing protein [Gordonibacter sp. Marseille-P4307]
MGNRAVITTPDKNLALYLHWNDGRDTVEPLFRYCELQGYRLPSSDSYGGARIAQVMCNFFGGSTSVGIDHFKNLGDQGDNGVYVIDGWKIVGRKEVSYDEDWNVNGWHKDAGRDGISGGHEKSAFEEKLREIGGRVIEETNILGIDGMKSVRYEVPKKDKAGNPTSEMSTISTPKSVYDKNVISAEEYMRRGLEAANNAATANNGSLSRSWNGTDNNGIKWKGYLDDNGNVSTLYPTI